MAAAASPGGAWQGCPGHLAASCWGWGQASAPPSWLPAPPPLPGAAAIFPHIPFQRPCPHPSPQSPVPADVAQAVPSPRWLFLTRVGPWRALIPPPAPRRVTGARGARSAGTFFQPVAAISVSCGSVPQRRRDPSQRQCTKPL